VGAQEFTLGAGGNCGSWVLLTTDAHGLTWRGLWPQPNPKLEIRNPKQIQMTKNGKFKTKYANVTL